MNREASKADLCSATTVWFIEDMVKVRIFA